MKIIKMIKIIKIIKIIIEIVDKKVVYKNDENYKIVEIEVVEVVNEGC